MKACVGTESRDSIVLGELVELFQSRAVGAILSRLDLESRRRGGTDVVPSGPVRQRPRDSRDLLIWEAGFDVRTANALENILTPKAAIEPRMEHYTLGRLCAWSLAELAAELGPATAKTIRDTLAGVRLKLRGG